MISSSYGQKFSDKGPKAFRTGVVQGNVASNTPTPRPQAAPQQNLIQKAGAVASQTGKLAAGVGKATAGFVKNTAVDIYQDAFLTGRTIVDAQTTALKVGHFTEMSNALNDKQDRVIMAYKEGKLSKDDYNTQLKELTEARQRLTTHIKPALDGPSAGERIEAIASTAFTVLSLGGLGVAKSGIKTVADDVLVQGSNQLERLIFKVPAARSLVLRNMDEAARLAASQNTAQYLARNAKQVAVGLLIKRPLFYQANLADARSGLDAIMTSNPTGAVKSAAWLGVQLLDGGPLGAMSKGYKWLKGETKMLAYGRGSALDALSRRIGSGDPNQLANLVQDSYKLSKETGKQVEEALRILQHQQLTLYADDVDGWADNVIEYTGTDPMQLTAEDLIANARRHRDADILGQAEVKKLVAKGKLTPEDARGWTPVRWGNPDRDKVAKFFTGTPDIQLAYQNALGYLEKRGLNNNPGLMATLERIVNQGGDGKAIASAIRSIDAAAIPRIGIGKAAQRKLAKLGYIYAQPVGGRRLPFIEDWEDTPKLISDARNGVVDLFDEAIAPQPVIAGIKDGLRAVGLSPEAASRKGQLMLTESVAKNLKGTAVAQMLGKADLPGAKVILTKLQNYVEHMKPSRFGRALSLGAAEKSAVTDIRQLTRSEVVEALSSSKLPITKGQAGEILDAINKGYMEVPMELRGLGDKVVDTLYRVNPAQKLYARVQSALRYTYNPFFRLQETVEASILAGAAGGNRIKNLASHNGLWNRSRAELDATVAQLDSARIFSSSLGGEAASDQILGRISANLTQGQKRDLAGLAIDIANKKGTDVATLLKDSPDEIADALRVIVQYPREGVLASSLARTLNVAFFPMRYNAKVTMLAGQFLAKQPAYVQKAALHGLFQTSAWLKSDEGIRWQSEYADALEVFKWLTPVNSVQYTLNLLNGGPDSPAEMGLLGGLPLGVITQILDSQGIIDNNTPYVNMRSGDVMPKYIPETAKARAATALTDLLGSTFTYPGRTLGLPGKNEQLRKAVKAFIATSPEDFNIMDETGNLTPLQRNMVRVLKGDTSDEALEAVYNSSITGYNGFTLPPAQLQDLFPQAQLSVPTRPPRQKSTRSSGPRAKKTSRPFPN